MNKIKKARPTLQLVNIQDDKGKVQGVSINPAPTPIDDNIKKYRNDLHMESADFTEEEDGSITLKWQPVSSSKHAKWVGMAAALGYWRKLALQREELCQLLKIGKGAAEKAINLARIACKYDPDISCAFNNSNVRKKKYLPHEFKNLYREWERNEWERCKSAGEPEAGKVSDVVMNHNNKGILASNMILWMQRGGIDFYVMRESILIALGHTKKSVQTWRELMEEVKKWQGRSYSIVDKTGAEEIYLCPAPKPWGRGRKKRSGSTR